MFIISTSAGSIMTPQISIAHAISRGFFFQRSPYKVLGNRANLFSMAPIVYRSPLPSIPLYAHSIFTHLFSSAGPNDVGGFKASLPAFIDSVTGTTLTRGQLRKLALSLGYGLQKLPTLSAKRGDTVMIYSQNSLAWPVVLFGSGKCFQ
jgi:hypothetical protein